MNAASKNQTQYLLLDKEVGKFQRELSRISKRKSDLYEDYSERLITEEEYILLDGSVRDAQVLDFLDMSYDLIDGSK